MTELLSDRDLTVVEAIARRVLELLDQRPEVAAQPPTAALVDATELARLLSVSRAWVYDHASELGAVELALADGERPRLRFDPERALAKATRRLSGERSQTPDPPEPAPIQRDPRRRRRTAARSDAGLLPVKGREAA